MLKKGQIIINKIEGKSKSLNIYIYGVIASWDVNGKNLAKILDENKDKYKKLNIYINSDGGSVTDGIAIFNILLRSNYEITIYIDGVAASMAAVLVQLPKAKRYMAKYTRLMMHKVSGMAIGSSDDIRNTADIMDSFEDDLITIISERIDIPENSVKEKWFNGKDNWLTPQQALDEKLIDGIIENKHLEKEPENINNVNDMIDFYDNQIINFNKNNTQMDFTKIINALKMKADSTEAEIMSAIQNKISMIDNLTKEKNTLKAENDTLKNQIEEQKKSKIKNLIDNAILEKKFTEEKRELYTRMANSNYDDCKAVIDALPTPQSLKNFINQGDVDVISEDRKKWTFQDWQKKDGKGLENLKENHKEIYDELYKKAFPKK